MPDGIEPFDYPQHPVERSRPGAPRPDQPRPDQPRPDVPRPLPQRDISERARAWVAWFGIARMLALGATVLLVGVGGYWLLHAPPPPVEASLPFAATTTSAGPAGGAGGSAASGAATGGTSSTPPTTATAAPVFVHVAGAVAAPSVYQLPPGSRVVHAIDAAGGPVPAAALDGLNLAATVVDGQRVYVPVTGEVDPATVDNGPTSADLPPVTGQPSAGDAGSAPVDLNRATSVELETLPGVGPSTAAAIIEDRQRNGPFATVDDVDRVAGIGPATLARLRELVTV
jgi:competence protein ComEA